MPDADYLTTTKTITGDELVRCTTCGSEGEDVDDLEHHPNCPDGGSG